MYNVFLIKRIMTMIVLMSAILVFSAQNSFQIAFKNLKASWQIFSSDLLSKFWKQIAGKFLKAFWKQIAGKFLKAFWKQIAGKFLKANRWQNFES